MAYISLGALLEKSGGSVYNLVVLVSKRALEIAEGQPKMVEADSSMKPSAVAFKEVMEGKLQYKNHA